jgi:hypothetical protein
VRLHGLSIGCGAVAPHRLRGRLLAPLDDVAGALREDDGETVTWIVRQIALPAPGVRPAGV